MMKSHQPPMHPSWHQRATRAEINEVTAIDKLIVNLRVRRETIINRVNMRTRVWVVHHPERKRALPETVAAHRRQAASRPPRRRGASAIRSPRRRRA
jgi:hypothetical protein